jgi:hypothetical protein
MCVELSSATICWYLAVNQSHSHTHITIVRTPPIRTRVTPYAHTTRAATQNPERDQNPECPKNKFFASFTLFSHSFHTLFTPFSHSFHTLFTLFSHSFHTLFTLFSHSFHALFTLFSHSFHALFALFSHSFHTLFGIFTIERRAERIISSTYHTLPHPSIPPTIGYLAANGPSMIVVRKNSSNFVADSMFGIFAAAAIERRAERIISSLRSTCCFTAPSFTFDCTVVRRASTRFDKPARMQVNYHVCFVSIFVFILYLF